MKQIPIDLNEFNDNIKAFIGIEPVVDFDTGEHRKDRDGRAKYRLQLLYKTARQRKPDVVEVGFASHEEPQLHDGTRPAFHGLIGRHWHNENEYGASSGVSLSAEAIDFTPRRAQANRTEEAA